MLAPSRILHSSKFSVSYGNLNQNYYTMALLSPSQDLAEETRAAMERQLEQQTRDATSGVLRRPGRGKRAGQWVQSGGEFNNLTQDEVYGRLRARQGGNSGSGPGGGLRTGGLSQGSGIDWLKANGPDRYSPSRLRQMERNVDITGDAGKLSKVDQVIFDKQESDKAAKAAADAKAAKAAADAKAAAVQPTAPAAPAQFDSLNTPVGQTAKPAIPPMIARPAVPATPASPDPLAPASANPYPKAAPAAPPVLQKPAPQAFVPDAKTKLAQSMEDVKNMQSKDRRDSVLNSAKSMIANPRAIPYGGAYADQFNERDPKRFDNDPAFQEWQKTDPDAIANRDREAGARASLQGFVNRGDAMKERAAKNMETNAVGADRGIMEGIVDKGMRFDPAASIQTGKERAAGLRSSMTQPLPPPVLNRPAIPIPTGKAPERADAGQYPPPKAGTPNEDGMFLNPDYSNMTHHVDDFDIDKWKKDMTNSTTTAPPVLQKPAKPTNQAVVGNVANKRRKNPLADMLKQGRNANFPSGIA